MSNKNKQYPDSPDDQQDPIIDDDFIDSDK